MEKHASSWSLFTRKLKSIFWRWTEKSSSFLPADLKDFELEHFLLYHGLVGTSPENQPQFREVRSDILAALANRSSAELAIALKLPPLWWADKLQSIFAEIKDTYHTSILACFLPEHTHKDIAIALDADPLTHTDWRVRANAAKIIAYLNLPEAFPEVLAKMIAALEDASQENKVAFCHLAYAAGLTGSEAARTALLKYLYDSEPWFRVDAAYALAQYPINTVAYELMQAVLCHHSLSDYMSIVIARPYPPKELLKLDNEIIENGALEIVINVLEAAKGSFSQEIVLDTKIYECSADILELVKARPCPRNIRAIYALVNWRTTNKDNLLAQVEASNLHTIAIANTLDWLRKAQTDLLTHSLDMGQVRHAIKLAGELNCSEAVPHLISLLQPGYVWINEVIASLEQLKAQSAGPCLVELLEELINIPERTAKPQHALPVAEDSPEIARTYWLGLKALGALPSEQSMFFLQKAIKDYAPDKREQAYSSLQRILGAPQLYAHFGEDFEAIAKSGLADPSARVKTTVLEGVAYHKLISCLPQILKLVHAKGTSLQRKACNTVVSLSQSGYRDVVITTVKAKIQREFGPLKRQQLKDLLESILVSQSRQESPPGYQPESMLR